MSSLVVRQVYNKNFILQLSNGINDTKQAELAVWQLFPARNSQTLLLNSGAHLRGNEQQSINTNFYNFLQSFYAMHAHRQVLQRIYAHIVSTTIVIEINTLMGFEYRSCSLEVQRLSICGTFQKAKE